eukprot:CAMPEP_0194708326 /NCGR_PEP_ID=MMETSP0296-20130528/1256_1 /TAXON_ID=39354 /ORGANISM="Heterosigma akashiwo, Strain CCMP2393" /LENGTH=362 /DNA_ID=CAMNT_0039605055 /DNA_START=283 /DNA_END=1372 /DNA_ORIENTATION=-
MEALCVAGDSCNDHNPSHEGTKFLPFVLRIFKLLCNDLGGADIDEGPGGEGHHHGPDRLGGHHLEHQARGQAQGPHAAEEGQQGDHLLLGQAALQEGDQQRQALRRLVQPDRDRQQCRLEGGVGQPHGHGLEEGVHGQRQQQHGRAAAAGVAAAAAPAPAPEKARDEPPPAPDLGEGGVSDARRKIREKLWENLGLECVDEHRPRLARLAIDIEVAADKMFELGTNPQQKKRDYGVKIRQINFNIKKNKELRDRIVNGEIAPANLVKMDADDFKTDAELEEKKRIQQQKLEESRMDWAQANNDKLNAMCGITKDEGLFTCARCKSKRTTHNQKQTRSSDEPMTVFAVCLDCGHRWKFSDSYF